MKMRKQIFGIAGCLLAATTASTWAQPVARSFAGNASAPLQLPKGIERLVSIDAHNFLFVEAQDPDNPDGRIYSVIAPKHVYSGGIAQLFGGTVVSTAQFLVPGGANLGGAQRGVNVSGIRPNAWIGNSGNNGFGNNELSNNGFGGGLNGGSFDNSVLDAVR